MNARTLPHQVRVARRTQSAQGVILLELVPMPGEALAPFTAGAHIDVQTPGGPIRQYSLCNPPGTPGYRIGILLAGDSRGGSSSLHSDVHEGAHLRIGAPRNLFAMASHDEPVLLLAGGIGITPLLAMAWALHSAEQPFTLHYCARSAAHAAFLEELKHAPFSDSVRLHFDDQGRVDLGAILSSDPESPVYLCGPPGFMQAAVQAAQTHGQPQRAVYQEHFQAIVEPEGHTAFTLVAARSGKTLQVEAGQKLCDVLAAAGIEVQLSCEQGICGTCLTRILEGQGDHRDSYQTDAEKAANQYLTVCCSSSVSERLVLDI